MNRIVNLVLFTVFLCLIPAALFAQSGDVPGEPVSLAQKVVIVTGMVYAVLQGLKKLLPFISGWPAQILALGAAIVGTYATAAPEQVFSLPFLAASVLSWLGAMGIHSGTRPAGVGG